jgi:hypothetical protein
LNDRGEIYIWGTGMFGEYLNPVKFSQTGNIYRDISVGGFFGGAIDDKGTLWGWGSNTSGELGLGDFEPRVHPYPNIHLQNKKIQRFACGGSFVMALGQIKRENLNSVGSDEDSLTRATYAGFIKTPSKHDHHHQIEKERISNSPMDVRRQSTKSPGSLKHFNTQTSVHRSETDTKHTEELETFVVLVMSSIIL